MFDLGNKNNGKKKISSFADFLSDIDFENPFKQQQITQNYKKKICKSTMSEKG